MTGKLRTSILFYEIRWWEAINIITYLNL